MPLRAAGEGWGAATVRWLQGLWAYYREYTQTAIHTASAAALTAFGLLIFIDRLFVLLAIAAYICPPLLLYSIDADAGRPPNSSEAATDRADSRPRSGADVDSDNGDSDSDSDDGDTDSDGTDADADADADDGDSDTDG